MSFRNFPLRISRSGLKLFTECPRCFWLDCKHKVKRPPGYPYTLSAAVDYLVKQEFDVFRKKGVLPPVFASEGIDAKLYTGPELAEWRENFKGISYYDEDLDATLYGAVDDILEFSDGSLAVVDYKSTGSREINIYNDYRQQMDIYSHLLGRNDFTTQPHAYFVFYIVDKTGGGFQKVLPFNEEIRRIDVDPSWVPEIFERAVLTARQDKCPEAHMDCKHCDYVHKAHSLFPVIAKSAPKSKSKTAKETEYIPVIE